MLVSGPYNFTDLENFMNAIRYVSIAILALVLSVSAYAETKTIILEKKNGDGTGGWNSVYEYHQETADGGSNHRLICSDPGHSVCAWSVLPRAVLINYAEGQIASGILSGTHTQVSQGMVYFVEWSASDANNYRIVETQTGTAGPGAGDELD